MSGFIPPECVSCHVALQELYSELNEGTRAVPSSHWLVAFSNNGRGVVSLSDNQRTKLRTAILKLQEQLCLGLRTACYAGNSGLIDIEPEQFLTEGKTNAIARGRYHPPGWSPSAGDVPLLLRMMERRAQKSKSHLPQKTGPKEKWPAVAKAYSASWPNGHKAAGKTNAEAMRDLSGQVDFEVKEYIFRKAMKRLKDSAQ